MCYNGSFLYLNISVYRERRVNYIISLPTRSLNTKHLRKTFHYLPQVTMSVAWLEVIYLLFLHHWIYRVSYDPDKYLWEKEFTHAGKAYKREDLELRNRRGQTLRCSHYVPSIYPTDSTFPCVIYCHGNRWSNRSRRFQRWEAVFIHIKAPGGLE